MPFLYCWTLLVECTLIMISRGHLSVHYITVLPKGPPVRSWCVRPLIEIMGGFLRALWGAPSEVCSCTLVEQIAEWMYKGIRLSRLEDRGWQGLLSYLQWMGDWTEDGIWGSWFPIIALIYKISAQTALALGQVQGLVTVGRITERGTREEKLYVT